jgi:hypothetical protein
VRGGSDGALDLTAAVHDPRNVLLSSQHGCLIFARLSPGIYEVHSAVLPEGRGRWAADFARACLHWMFTRTDALEIVTKCPRGNLAARTLALHVGMKPAFVVPDAWEIKGRKVDCEIMSLPLQSWLVTAPGLVERGDWVAAQMASSNVRLTARDDQEARRQVGLAFEMFLSGQIHKGVVFLGRWARMAGYGTAEVVSERPAALAFPGATVVMQDNGAFYLMGVDASAPTALL